MIKSKFFKAFGFSSLALLMGTAGVFAFVPLGASSSVANANEIETTTEQGLITTHKNDPTLYTTESGLDIKYGLSAPSINDALDSGNLAGFPYFTTTNGSTTYTWVIIGIAPDLGGSGEEKKDCLLFSDWFEKIYYVYAEYFKNNVFENTTPAGNAIFSSVANKAYILDYMLEHFPGAGSLPSNDEIADGCFLAISNTSVANSSYATYATYGGGYYSGKNTTTTYFGNGSNNLSNTLKGYYTNDTFGFGKYLSSIKTTSVTQHCDYWVSDGVDSNTTHTTSINFFPLDTSLPGVSNFCFDTYLTAEQVKLSTNVWCRSTASHSAPYCISTSGVANGAGAYSYGYSYGVRPAFVMSLA